MRKLLRDGYKIALSVLLGGAILYWMYRDFDFSAVRRVMLHEMNWWWMLLSFPFGVLAQAFRGWRWKQTLEPIGEHPRRSSCVNAIFLSYAVSLIVPRLGEFARCGVLNRKEGVSFPKAIGTVVTERAVDTLIIGIITMVVILSQLPVFNKFFLRTGTDFWAIMRGFSWEGYLVTAVCGFAVLLLLHMLLRKLAFYDRVRATARGILEGVMSVRKVRNIPLFLFLSIGIWVNYFLHYYLTFFCFESTAHLGISCAMVTFIVGTIAVIVPTPNGAGPWHFAVKTMLILYGVADNDALNFVLIVHTVQTLMVVFIGIYAQTRILTSK